MSGKGYPEEFKIEAVKHVVDRGHSVSSVATRLDITTDSRRFSAAIPMATSVFCAAKPRARVRSDIGSRTNSASAAKIPKRPNGSEAAI